MGGHYLFLVPLAYGADDWTKANWGYSWVHRGTGLFLFLYPGPQLVSLPSGHMTAFSKWSFLVLDSPGILHLLPGFQICFKGTPVCRLLSNYCCFKGICVEDLLFYHLNLNFPLFMNFVFWNISLRQIKGILFKQSRLKEAMVTCLRESLSCILNIE